MEKWRYETKEEYNYFIKKDKGNIKDQKVKVNVDKDNIEENKYLN